MIEGLIDGAILIVVGGAVAYAGWQVWRRVKH